MKPKTLYLALSLAGVIVPYVEFLPWLLRHGLNLRRLAQELFVTRVGAFFGLDVIVSALVVLVFAAVERRRSDLRLWWLPLVALPCVGVSLGLPLLLYLREVHRERDQPLAARTSG